MLQDASIILNFAHHWISTDAEWRPCLGFCKQVLCILHMSFSCSIISYTTFSLENSFSKKELVRWMADVWQVTVSTFLGRLLLCEHQPHYHFYSWSLTQLEPKKGHIWDICSWGKFSPKLWCDLSTCMQQHPFLSTIPKIRLQHWTFVSCTSVHSFFRAFLNPSLSNILLLGVPQANGVEKYFPMRRATPVQPPFCAPSITLTA